MTVAEVDAYIAQLEEPKRGTFEEVRRRILAVVPEAEQVISYGCPAFQVGGRRVAGLAAFKNHLSYLPHSGTTLGSLGDELAGYEGTKSALHFPVDEALPADLVRRLVLARMQEAGLPAPA
jgi:uncharacterized protein YdhG (YjbR/CyaY superfamily)